MPVQVVPLKTQPGIKRDGTRFEGESYVDGQWVRFQRGLPRKIWGYRVASRYPSEICRGIHAFTLNNQVYIHHGSRTKLERFILDENCNPSANTDRVAATMTASANNVWMFDVMADASDYKNYLIAHVGQNLLDINNSSGGEIFVGDITATTDVAKVTLATGANASGGVVVLHPYLFYYGHSGVIGWSIAGDPANLTGAGSGVARVWGSKIIKGLPLRAGGGSSPAGLFIADDAVLRASFTGGSTVFAFDTIATGTSILSSNCVVDYDGIIFWAGVDRFLMFNGVVREVPNQFNVNYFFDNLNFEQRQKVFAFSVPRFGEIWWCYPRGAATECTHAVIFNARENCWYDTELPSDGRTAGTFSNYFRSPLLTSATVVEDAGLNQYRVWRHETGLDSIDGTTIDPIDSYFETSDLSLSVQGKNQKVRVSIIEPDFVQSGDMSVQVVGRANARATEIYSTKVTFPDDATSDPSKQIVMMKEQRRELRIKFESNAVGGDYQMGQTLLHIDQGDGTVTG